MEITKSRLLCYLAAVQADEYGFKAAKAYIAMTKVDAPRMCLKILDEAIQAHGAHGVSQDSRLSGLYTHVRHVRLETPHLLGRGCKLSGGVRCSGGACCSRGARGGRRRDCRARRAWRAGRARGAGRGRREG